MFATMLRLLIKKSVGSVKSFLGTYDNWLLTTNQQGAQPTNQHEGSTSNEVAHFRWTNDEKSCIDIRPKEEGVASDIFLYFYR